MKSQQSYFKLYNSELYLKLHNWNWKLRNLILDYVIKTLF